MTTEPWPRDRWLPPRPWVLILIALFMLAGAAFIGLVIGSEIYVSRPARPGILRATNDRALEGAIAGLVFGGILGLGFVAAAIHAWRVRRRAASAAARQPEPGPDSPESVASNSP